MQRALEKIVNAGVDGLSGALFTDVWIFAFHVFEGDDDFIY